MDHKAFLASLPPDLTVQLTKKRNAAPLLHLAAHLALILLTGTLIALRVPFWPALLLPHGIFLIFLFTLEHEATHKTPFASPALNEAVGRVIGVIIFLPFLWFRYFHLAHHRYTNDPANDPELLAGAKPENRRDYVCHVSGLPYWAAMATQIVLGAAGRANGRYLPEPARPRITAEARWMVLIYGIAAGSLTLSPVLFWVWLLPLLLGQPFLRLFLLAEHGRCAFVADMFKNTRTTFTTRFIRFLSWNMPYHCEHHIMPNVPFHNLPHLHEFTRSHLRVTDNGYTGFSRKFAAGLSARQ